MGGCLLFVKHYAEIFRDHEVLDILTRRDEHEKHMAEIAACCKGTKTDVVMKTDIGVVTDEIKMKTSATSAMVEQKDGTVDTDGLQFPFVEKYQQLVSFIRENRYGEVKLLHCGKNNYDPIASGCHFRSQAK